MNKKKIFVIMPFSGTEKCTTKEWTDIYTDLFVPTFNELGYECNRISPETGSLIKSILNELRNSPIVLADLTDKNPNVFYELGVRHSLSKRTILVSQDFNDIPSDLKGYWSIIYETSLTGITHFKKEMRKIISKIKKNPEYSDNPVSDYLEKENLSIFKQKENDNLKKLSALLTEFSSLKNTLKEIKQKPLYKNFIYHECINLLLNTYYIDLGQAIFQKLYELRLNLKVIKHSEVVDSKLISETIDQTISINKRIEDLHQKISQGGFEEPSQGTMLIWESINEDLLCTPPTRKYSKIKSINQNDLDELT